MTKVLWIFQFSVEVYRTFQLLAVLGCNQEVSEIMVPRELAMDNQGPLDYGGQPGSPGLWRTNGVFWIGKGRYIKIQTKLKKVLNGPTRLYLVLCRTIKALENGDLKQKVLVIKIQEIPRFPGIGQ